MWILLLIAAIPVLIVMVFAMRVGLLFLNRQPLNDQPFGFLRAVGHKPGYLNLKDEEIPE